MDSKKNARWPPSRYCTLCFEVATSTSIPASSIRRSSRSASKGILGDTLVGLTTSSMVELLGADAYSNVTSNDADKRKFVGELRPEGTAVARACLRGADCMMRSEAGHLR